MRVGSALWFEASERGVLSWWQKRIWSMEINRFWLCLLVWRVSWLLLLLLSITIVIILYRPCQYAHPENHPQIMFTSQHSSLGETVRRGTLEYAAPEVIKALHHATSPIATHAIDMFSLGRLLQWLSSELGTLWPEAVALAGQEIKEKWLIADEEIVLDETLIPHRPTRNVIYALLRKNPVARLTLKNIRVCKKLAFSTWQFDRIPLSLTHSCLLDLVLPSWKHRYCSACTEQSLVHTWLKYRIYNIQRSPTFLPRISLHCHRAALV